MPNWTFRYILPERFMVNKLDLTYNKDQKWIFSIGIGSEQE